MSTLTSEERCPHGIRWPHPCRECEDAPLPSNPSDEEVERLLHVLADIQNVENMTGGSPRRSHKAAKLAAVREWFKQNTPETFEEPPVMGAGSGPAPMPTVIDAVEAHVRQIQQLCDGSNLDPTQWLNDYTAQGEHAPKAVEQCSRCGGTGLATNTDGDIDECNECGGNTVVPT